ncbi:MAG: hypothetical protein ACHQLQ_08665 [Candidatus Acidiferrales bacterium]
MKVRNGRIVAEFTVYVFLPVNFGWLFWKAALRPFPAGVEARA